MNLRGKVAVGCGDHAHIHLNLPAVSDTGEPPPFEHAQ